MERIFSIIFTTSLLTTSLLAQEEVAEKRDRIPSVKKAIGSVGATKKKDVSVVSEFEHMFRDGKVTGQFRTMYAGYNQEQASQSDTYATAIGGGLKYELASLYGFNGAVAFITSQDLRFATGKKAKQNSDLSSSKGNYTQMSEAYINYSYDKFNFRAGRQSIDTPLADSDDVRMIPNTFEAYIATYEIDNLTLMVGNLQKWQGFDAGLDDGWVDTGKYGTNFGGISYDGKNMGYNLWYYNITGNTNAFYADIQFGYDLDKDFSIHSGIQYLNESELDNSGTQADIYGVMLEFVAYDLGFNFAYDKANKKTNKSSFSGTGGGAMYTGMDTMIIDEIATDRDADAIVVGLSYALDNLNMLYAYGDFSGARDSLGDKAHIVEQDIGFNYDVDKELGISAIYVIQEDKESSQKTSNDWNRFEFMIDYNF